MKVCIAEKPSVAREIAHILGANSKQNGYYEGNGYAVTYTFGHLCTLLEPADYKPEWKNWHIHLLPMLPEKFDTKVSDNSGIKKQFAVIQSLLKKASVVINCGDAGTEGELIQRWVINQCQYNGEVQRLWISSLTEEAIKEGFENLKPASDYDNLFYAGYSRAIGDWLLGLNATRLYTVKFGGYKQVLSIGRVQTPTLAMLVNRYKEIRDFKPQPYWELQTTYRETTFSYEEGRFENQEEGQLLADKVKQSEFEIVSITKKKGKELAPKLFDLTGLQVYCNTKFGYSADDTLKIVQKLYEMKLVTYPRVDTTFLPNDIYPKVPGILSRLTHYSTLTEPLLDKKIRKSAQVFNDKKVTDHHAIIPTGVETGLPQNQQVVYDIIVRRFIAVFYPDSEVSNTAVLAKAAEVPFKTTGKEILTQGWRVVFEKENSKKKTETLLPTFEKGEKGPHEPSFTQKETKPPRNYTEASLLRAMETAGKQVDDEEMRELMKENGIGRPSTRASIIETLFHRKYIERNKKLVQPTETGIALIELIDNELLKSAELTGLWEKRLKEIERGEYSAGKFILNMKKMVFELVQEVKAAQTTKRISSTPIPESKPANHAQSAKAKPAEKSAKKLVGKTCPKCKKGQLIKGGKAYGCSDYKQGCHFVIPFEFYAKKISENQLIRLIDKGSTTNLKGFKTEVGEQAGSLVLDESFRIVFTPKKEDLKTTKDSKKSEKIICPKCKKGTVIKGKKAFGCSEYKSGCDFVFTFKKVKEKANEKQLTKELVREIISEGFKTN